MNITVIDKMGQEHKFTTAAELSSFFGIEWANMLITRWGDGVPTRGIDVSDIFDTTISFVIKYVSPEVGYCAFAGQDIPAGTDIAAYTGMIGKVSESTSTQQSLYALQVDKDCCVDASYAGNISRFFCHLPKAQDLANYNFSSVELHESVATSNVDHRVDMLSLSSGSVLPCLVLVAKRMIKAGEIIGFDYSLDYWRNLDKRPKFLANDGTILTGITPKLVDLVLFRNGRKWALITVKDEAIRSDRYVIFPELSASLPLEIIRQKLIDGTYRVDDTQLLKITELRTTYLREAEKAIKYYRDKKYAEAKSGFSKVFGCLKAICSLCSLTGADAKEEHIEAEKQIAVVFYNVGSICIQLGDYTQALAMMVGSLDIRKKYFRAEDAEIVKIEKKIEEIKSEQAAFESAVATPLPKSDSTPRPSV